MHAREYRLMMIYVRVRRPRKHTLRTNRTQNIYYVSSPRFVNLSTAVVPVWLSYCRFYLFRCLSELFRCLSGYLTGLSAETCNNTTYYKNTDSSSKKTPNLSYSRRTQQTTKASVTTKSKIFKVFLGNLVMEKSKQKPENPTPVAHSPRQSPTHI